jgi:ribosome maturation protein Sdo1
MDAAKRHIEGMPEEQRTELVKDAVREILSNIDISEVIKPMIEQHTRTKTREILQEVEFDKLFIAAIKDGARTFLRALPKATAVAMVGMFTGLKDYEAGTVHKALQTMIDIEHKKTQRDGYGRLPKDDDIPF